MITSSGIQFQHYRIDYEMQGEQYVSGATQDLGALPVLAIKSISVDKSCQKVYSVISRRKSAYLPTGMIGPQVQLVCSSETPIEESDIFANDFFQVTEFGFTTWATILKENSTWWVDVFTCTATSEKPPHGGNVRWEISMTLYKRGDSL